MDSGLPYLLSMAAFVGFFHTLTGPDHYLPFVMIARARNWSSMKTFWIALGCGIGHVGSSILLGIIGIIAGIGVSKLNVIEASRGEIASWIIIIFGLGYMVWGLIHARKHHHHGHPHSHSLNPGKEADSTKKANVTPWILFLIFVFGPCEPLIPLFIYPAAQQSMIGVVLVSLVFTVTTLITMLTIIMLSLNGLKAVKFGFVERYTHAIAGATICLCGLAIVFLGL